MNNYILVDYENLQPKNLKLLVGQKVQVLIFVGASQQCLPFGIVSAMQEIGRESKFIKISGNGKNALDFHLTFYLGSLVEKDSKAFFHILSKDTGFDRLVEHLKAKNLRVSRHSDIAKLPLFQRSSPSPIEEQIQLIVKKLKGRGQSKPRKESTLLNTIKSDFSATLSDAQMVELFNQLKSRGIVKLNGEKVTYNFPE